MSRKPIPEENEIYSYRSDDGIVIRIFADNPDDVQFRQIINDLENATSDIRIRWNSTKFKERT